MGRHTTILERRARITGLLRSLLFRIVAAVVVSVVLVYCLVKYYLVELPRRRPPKVHAGRDEQPTGLWCICAIYQPKKASRNLVSFITCLRDAGYNVIAVHNGPMAQAVIDELCGVCHLVMVRSTGGRDFGSYKAGTQFLHTLAPQRTIKQVVYCNDSIFVRPSSLRSILANVRDMGDDYIGVMETFEYRYHIHSWFFAVSNQLFCSPEFQEFWTRYRPLSNRIYAIRYGEIRLTNRLVKRRVYPTVLYTASRVLHGLFKDDQPPDISQLILLSNTRTCQHIVDLVGSINPTMPDTEVAMVIRRLSDLSALENAANLFNLLLLRSADFPFLKKDLVYKGGYFCAQINEAIDHWRDDDAIHLPEIRGYFRSRDALHWQNAVHRVLARAGVI